MQGCIELLDRSGVVIEGKEAVVLGRSNIVGKQRSLDSLGPHNQRCSISTIFLFILAVNRYYVESMTDRVTSVVSKEASQSVSQFEIVSNNVITTASIDDAHYYCPLPIFQHTMIQRCYLLVLYSLF